MSEYIIFTDSACDLSPAALKEWNVDSCSLSFVFDGEDHQYGNHDMSVTDFYAHMRSGKVAKTSAVNPDTFAKAFKPYLEQGMDILYLGFSGALSTTYASAGIAAADLLEDFPQRKILTVDTLSASAGIALLVYLTVQKKAQVCQWFTTDTLTYLKRGGRVSATTAIVGNMLDIRPVLHVAEDGSLGSVKKVRGRKASVQALCDRLVQTAHKDTPVFISHADCKADAKKLTELIREKTGLQTTLITNVGPVIGAHAGPGTLALFFLGSER